VFTLDDDGACLLLEAASAAIFALTGSTPAADDFFAAEAGRPVPGPAEAEEKPEDDEDPVLPARPEEATEVAFPSREPLRRCEEDAAPLPFVETWLPPAPEPLGADMPLLLLLWM